jgi:DNA modification methylase
VTAGVLRGDARRLPLPDGCVDLIVTSPPYFGLRDYGYAGQIGSEATPGEWLEALWACTAEWVRVLKPEGSLFVNLGDKYSNGGRTWYAPGTKHLGETIATVTRPDDGAAPKSLLGLPWRYAIGCMDRLGLILRAEVIWAKPNGLPESVTDRVRRAHEQVFHFTRQPRYYAAVDEIREPHTERWGRIDRTRGRRNINPDGTPCGGMVEQPNPLGQLPGSVWEINEGDTLITSILRAVAAGAITIEEGERLWTSACEPASAPTTPGDVWSIPSSPLQVPARLGVDHFAAFPPALVRPIVLGWSPPGVCTACGQGRRPVVHREVEFSSGSGRAGRTPQGKYEGSVQAVSGTYDIRMGPVTRNTITGYACACPEPDAPSRPSLVVDPFGGTGTTALVASAYGRHAITVDLSADYCRLAAWRVSDPGERARARELPKPPPAPDGMEPLFIM